MPRSPFEQLQDVVAEPRQAFEDIATLILRCLDPGTRRVRVHKGDGGIDLFSGSLARSGEVDVYQMKYFVGPWGDSQKQQIRDSYETAAGNNEYRLRTWTLCMPVRLRREDLRWFDDWRGDRAIELLDGDDLASKLDDDRCATARRQLRDWGIVGIRGSGPQLLVSARIGRPNHSFSAFTYCASLFIRNNGDATAREIGAVVEHSETNCVAGGESTDWPSVGGILNPRNLRFRNVLNPGQGSLIMEILLCDRSTFPLRISVVITAENCLPRRFGCSITALQFATTTSIDLVEG